MRELLDFLTALSRNNSKLWFDAHKQQWLTLRERLMKFSERLIAEISTFDSDVAGLMAKDCTYRIYQDMRFHGREPYKTWQGIYIAAHGKCGGYAGYYMHISPEQDKQWDGGCFLTAGLYLPEPKILRSVREEIIDNGELMRQNIAAAKGFELEQTERLSRTPKGFPTDTPYDELLRLKNFLITQHLDIALLSDTDRLLSTAAAAFKLTTPFVQQLNRAVQYAKEEM